MRELWKSSLLSLMKTFTEREPMSLIVRRTEIQDCSIVARTLPEKAGAPCRTPRLFYYVGSAVNLKGAKQEVQVSHLSFVSHPFKKPKAEVPREWILTLICTLGVHVTYLIATVETKERPTGSRASTGPLTLLATVDNNTAPFLSFCSSVLSVGWKSTVVCGREV